MEKIGAHNVLEIAPHCLEIVIRNFGPQHVYRRAASRSSQAFSSCSCGVCTRHGHTTSMGARGEQATSKKSRQTNTHTRARAFTSSRLQAFTEQASFEQAIRLKQSRSFASHHRRALTQPAPPSRLYVLNGTSTSSASPPSPSAHAAATLSQATPKRRPSSQRLRRARSATPALSTPR